MLHEEVLLMFQCRKQVEAKPMPKAKRLRKKQRKKILADMDQAGPLFIFEKEMRIDLTKCELHLKPDDLPIRRIWNKKYPIKLAIPPEAIRKGDIQLSYEELMEELKIFIDEEDRDLSPSIETEEIFLFANTGREKEDWFYRMQLCVDPLLHQISFDDIRNKQLPDKPRSSYPHYIVELMTESEKVMQRNIKGKKMEPYLAWLNIFLGRAFWDVWHESYWRDKVAQKIQTRLTKIDTPPFIKGIRLKDINLGHKIPIIHKGSLPVLDEYGIWSDLQISYKGYFTLTLETQLNVDYYVTLVSNIVKNKKAEIDASDLSKMTKMSDIKDQHDGPISNQEDLELLADELPEEYLEAFDTVDNPDAEGQDMDPFMSDPRTRQFLQSKTGKKLVGVVGWLAKSKIAKRVAETEFAKKAYEKAYEKFRKMPIILKVEVQSIKGNLAVNLPPPPTNRLW